MAAERFLWIAPDAARALARRIAIAGDRLVRVEGHANPAHPDTGLVWRVIVRDETGGIARTDEGETPLNDTWWCPPWCTGTGPE